MLVGDEAVRLPLPETVDMKAEIDGYLIATMRKEWAPGTVRPFRKAR